MQIDQCSVEHPQEIYPATLFSQNNGFQNAENESSSPEDLIIDNDKSNSPVDDRCYRAIP